MRTEHEIEQEAIELFDIDINNTVYDSYQGIDIKKFKNFEDAEKYRAQLIRQYVKEKLNEE